MTIHATGFRSSNNSKGKGICWRRVNLRLRYFCVHNVCAAASMKVVHSKQLRSFSLLWISLCSVRSHDVNPLLQTVHSNILILLQFTSCVAVHQWRSQRWVLGVQSPHWKMSKKISEDKIVENTQSWSLQVLKRHQTTSLALTDLQILGCELHENAFGGEL